MPKYKKYYKKRNNNWNIVPAFFWLIIIFIILLWQDSHDLLKGVVLIIIILISLTVLYFLFKKIRSIKNNKLLPEKVSQIKEKIITFKPLRLYSKEEPYQIELSWYLKNFFPELNIEISKNYTRPDIIIWNIAIEIKWPTTFSELKTIPDKIIRYTKEWDYLIIVLFNMKISDEIYYNWKRDIEENFASKLDKIMFIEI